MRIQYEGTVPVRAGRDEVRRFVTDPERVGRCLPDLQTLEVTDARRFTAWVRAGVGPIRGTFKMEIELDPSGDEIGMRLRGSGMGSGLQMNSSINVAGGEAGAEIRWRAEATISGPLAAVGGRLLDGQARKVIEQLFANVRAALEGETAGGDG